jgi:hypothetical protein
MQKKTASSKTKKSVVSRKRGANPRDPAKRQQKRDNNFKQSKDVREDRGVRQIKNKPKNQNPGRGSR